MKSNNLEKILKEFVEKNEYKSILINGPWGCGKTYEANKFIKEHNSYHLTISDKDFFNTFFDNLWLF